MRQMISIILLMAGVVFCGEYQVDKDKKNMVKFISDAPIEDIEGITDRIDGYLYWEGSDYTNNSEIYLEVDLNSLDTGIGLRNRHMRENYLETDRFPITHFKGKVINGAASNDSTVSIEAEGVIFIHGVEKPINVKGSLIKKGNGFRIKTNFEVKLSDFQVEIPSIMFYKIDEIMDLVLDFYVKENIKE
jgi:polyisoprenoid-binding protein YceI